MLPNDKVFAFISYSRKDKKVANWLHKRIENYIYPKELVNEDQRPPHDKYIRPVFLDTKDMQIEVRPFTERIKNALENAQFLILICSHNSAKSPFVNKEIKYFLENNDYNYSRIVPLFIDEVMDDTIPDAIKNTTIMSRHFPIYNMALDEKSEANSYCYYQIIAYLLGVNFSDIYNRYEVDTMKRTKQRKTQVGIAITTLLLIILALGAAIYKNKELINSKNELIESKNEQILFEKKVFPAAVVHGYEENFLSPVINYFKWKGDPFMIYIMMPTSYRDLQHKDRITDINFTLKQQIGIDSLTLTHLPTSMRRGSRILTLTKDGDGIPGIYIDFASTTTSFFKIAEYKKNHPAYHNVSIDDIIDEYTNEFIIQTNEKLKSDSAYVKFFTDKNDLINELRTTLQPQGII